MGVRLGCKPRTDVLQGELDDAIFAASFGKLVRDEGPLIYRDPSQFFTNTHPTAALSRLCRDVFERLGSTSEAGAVLRLSTGFGGGKTHALMALWHLARTVANPIMGTELLPPAGRPASVRVVGIDAEGGWLSDLCSPWGPGSSEPRGRTRLSAWWSERCQCARRGKFRLCLAARRSDRGHAAPRSYADTAR